MLGPIAAKKCLQNFLFVITKKIRNNFDLLSLR